MGARLAWSELCKGYAHVTRFVFSSLGAGASLAIALMVAPVAAQAPGLAMLGELERGQWQVRDRAGGAPRLVCLGDARQLLQLRHPRSDCSRYVITDSAAEVTVHYTCPGVGHGRTTIRRETNRLVQIDTQGIASGAPFSDAYEGRRIGPC
jgi:hypothetical protein